MKSLTKNTVDKSSWPDGPWKAEPDKAQWLDGSTNYPCLIVRGPFGALCGYVGVPNWHPDYGSNYNDVDVSVHGGLTYSDKCDPAGHICHIVEPGDDDDIWWLGFDCAHSGDHSPANTLFHISGSTYRTVEYVTDEIRDLATQLKRREEEHKHG